MPNYACLDHALCHTYHIAATLEPPSVFNLDPPLVPVRQRFRIKCSYGGKSKTWHLLIAESYSQYRIHQILDISRFSKKGKLLRTITWIMRFISNLKSAIKKQELSKEEYVSVNEINEADIILVRSLQTNDFSSEIGYFITKAPSKTPLRPISTSFGFRNSEFGFRSSDANSLSAVRIRTFAIRFRTFAFDIPNLPRSEVLFFIRFRIANKKFPDVASQSECCVNKTTLN